MVSVLLHNVEQTKELFSQTAHIVNFKELREFINKVNSTRKPSFSSLKSGINEFTQYIHRVFDANFNFYRDLLPTIIKWSLQFEYHRELPTFRCNINKIVTFTTEEVRFILSNAFFLNINSEYLDFNIIYQRMSISSVQRVVCNLSYYYQLANRKNEQEGRRISFHRRNLQSVPKVDWLRSEERVTCAASNITVHTKRMEFHEHTTFVDFANRILHIGTIIPSLTQEEVLFSCCPELFVGLLFCCDEIDERKKFTPGGDSLASYEVVVVEGVRRFSEYTGYLESFRFKGFHREEMEKSLLVFNTLVLDACCVGFAQFKNDFLLRDLNKAYLGFAISKLIEHNNIMIGNNNDNDDDSNNGSGGNNNNNAYHENRAYDGNEEEVKIIRDDGKKTVISTGHWGCGAFGGDKTYKFVQQIMAAQMSNVHLDYSTFNEDETKEIFDSILQLIDRKRPSLSTLCTICLDYDAYSRTPFHIHLMRGLDRLH